MLDTIFNNLTPRSAESDSLAFGDFMKLMNVADLVDAKLTIPKVLGYPWPPIPGYRGHLSLQRVIYHDSPEVLCAMASIIYSSTEAKHLSAKQCCIHNSMYTTYYQHYLMPTLLIASTSTCLSSPTSSRL